MCISASASINAFLFNLISVGLLIKYGNENLKTYNLIVGIFAIFTSLMQLVDLGIWLDLDCKNGLNKAASTIGPVLTYLQPTMVFVVAYFVLKYTSNGQKLTESLENTSFENFTITDDKFNFNNVINLLYFGFIVYDLVKYFIKESKSSSAFCCGIVDNHVKWNWVGNYNNTIIHAILYALIGIMNLYSINPYSSYIKLVIVLYICQYLVSKIMTKNHLSEIWCLISNSLPLTLLIIQKIIPSYLS
jgi:hypothetical protein